MGLYAKEVARGEGWGASMHEASRLVGGVRDLLGAVPQGEGWGPRGVMH